MLFWVDILRDSSTYHSLPRNLLGTWASLIAMSLLCYSKNLTAIRQPYHSYHPFCHHHFYINHFLASLKAFGPPKSFSLIWLFLWSNDPFSHEKGQQPHGTTTSCWWSMIYDLNDQQNQQPFFPQQRKLMGSSAQISSGVCRCGLQEQVPEEGSGRFRRVPECAGVGSGGRFRKFRCKMV